MEKENEVWRDVPGYKNYYQVSDEGNVKSLDRTVITKRGERFYKGRFFEGSDVRGYKMVGLSRDGKAENFYVHQLVAVCFLNHAPDGHTLVVDHIDGDKFNNRVENLQIVTQRENTSTCHRKYRNTLSSDFIGVCFSKTHKKFKADIVFNNKRIYLGLFDNEEDASNAYQKALAELENGTFKIENYRASFTSKYKSVYFNKDRNKWVAKPTINGNRIHLGYFATEEEAFQMILLFEAIQPILI